MSIQDDDVFDDKPPAIQLPSVQSILDSIKFSPQTAVNMLQLVDGILAQATGNKAFDAQIPLLDIPVKRLLNIGSVFTSAMFEFFVMVVPFNDRATKSLIIKGGDISSITPADETDYNADFELYVLRNDLTVNPFPERAAEMRTQAEAEGGLCNIQIPIYTDDNDSFLSAVVASVTESSECTVDVCRSEGCHACIDDDGGELTCEQCDTSDECDKKKNVVEYRYCDCDAVVTVNENNEFALFTVSYKDEDEMNPNDIKLIGIFDKFTEGETLDVNVHYDFSINSPSHPAVVPRFKTMAELTARMSEVITNFTNVPTNITAIYTSASDDSYGSFLFGIEVQKSFNVGVSFSSSVSMGDFSTISVENSSLVLDGLFMISNEFGVILGPDTTQGLKISSQIDDATCTSSNKNLDFDIVLYRDDDPPVAHNITITSCVEGVAQRVETFRSRVNAVLDDDEVTVSLVGSSTLVLAFNPYWSKAEVIVPKENIYGLKNETQKKAGFHFANGASALQVGLGLSGSATVSASVLDTIEVAAGIDASVSGSLQFSSGAKGQLVPLDTWFSNFRSILDASDEFHEPGFASCTISVDGGFDATLQVKEPFALELQHSFAGSFKTPFQLDLLDISAVKTRRPDIRFDINLPNIGDIRNLSFGDVVKLLQLALGFLVGNTDNGDTVETCSGGLLANPTFLYKIPVLGVSACEFASFLQIVVDAIDQLVNDCTECNDPDAPKSSFKVLATKLSSILQEAVGGSPSVDFLPTSDDIRSSLEIDLKLEWSFMEAIELNIDLEAILEGLDLDENIKKFAKGIIGLDGDGKAEITGSMSFSLGIRLEYVKQSGKINPYLKGVTGVGLTFSANVDNKFQATVGSIPATIAVAASIDNYGKPLSILVGLNPNVNYYISTDKRLTRSGFQRVSSIGALGNEISYNIRGQVSAELDAELAGGIGKAFMRIKISDINSLIQKKPGAVALYYKVSTIGKPSFLDILLMDPVAIVNAVDSLLKSVNDLTLGRRGIVTTFPLPFIGTAVSRSLKAGSSDNFLEKARRTIKGTLDEVLSTYKVDDGESTVADLIANVLTDLLGNNLGILNENITVTYYEHNGQVSLTPHDKYNKDIDIKSLMWTIPFGQTYTIKLPPMNFDLGNENFPLQISTSADEQPTLNLTWSFKLAFGFDEKDGFFLYTFPHVDPSQEESEFFVRADFNLPVNYAEAKLLYFLNLTLADIDIAFGAGIFVNIDKSHGMRKADNPNSVKFGRLTIADLKRVPSKKDLFVICAAAAATVTVDDFSAELDLPIKGFDVVKPWIPKLNIGGDNEAQITALQAVIKKEKSTRRAATPKTRSLLLQPNDRHRLHASIPSTAHRGLRMLCAEEVVNVDIDCPVNIAAGEFACVKISDIRLDITKIQELVEPILRKFVNPPKNDGLLDEVAIPLSKLDERIPGISDIREKTTTFLDIAQVLVGDQSGHKTVRAILSIWRGLRTLATLFEEANDDGILLAGSCIFKPKQARICIGGTVDFATNDGSTRLLELAQEFENVFPTHDLSGQRVTAVHSHYRMLTAGCPTTFVKPNCKGSCTSCSGKVAKAKCKARQLKCKGSSIQGIGFPFMSDPASVIGLFSGGDIQIIKFDPPPMVFKFVKEIQVPVWSPPSIYLSLYFGCDATLEYEVVLDSKGIREAVQEKKPLKALSSFAIVDSKGGIDPPLITVTASVKAGFGVDVYVAKTGVQGGLRFDVEIDLYDPFPDTSGGLIRPFEMLALGTNPLQWFEFTVTIYVTFDIYIKLNTFLFGWKEVWSKEFSYKIYGPKKLTPKGFDKIGKVSSSGALFLQMTDLICESKGGSVGEEELQCWEADEEKLFPKIMKFKNVKKLEGGGLNKSSNRRRLAGDSREDIMSVRERRLESSTFQFNCILSETDMTGTNDVLINYERCQISSGILEIGLTQSIGVGVTTFSSALQTARVVLPSPIQDTLTTVVRDCNAEWQVSMTLDGHSNIEIHGSDVKPGCKIIADGTSEADAVITIDFGQISCTSGKSVSLNEGSITIDGKEIVSFGRPYKDIVFMMSNCDDQITIVKTYDDASSIEVMGHDGNDSIVIGDESEAFETNIFANIIIDGGAGSGDRLTVHDEGSSSDKPDTAVRPSMLSGLYDQTDKSIAYFDLENISMSLGIVASKVMVYSTARAVALTLNTQDGNDLIEVRNARGPLSINSGGGDDDISIKQTNGNITLAAGEGVHNVTISDTEGGIDINLGAGTSHTIALNNTRGDISIDTGDGVSSTTISETLGSIDLTVGSGASHTISLTHTGGAAVINAMTGDRTISAFNTTGSLTALLGDGDDIINLEKTVGNATLISGTGSHSCILKDTAGIVNVTVGGGPSFNHEFNLTETDGSVSITAGDGDCAINGIDTAGSLTVLLGNGDDNIFLQNTAAEVSITSGNGNRVMNAIDTSGSLTANLGDGDDIINLKKTEGSIAIVSGDGSHTCALDQTIDGVINITVGGGSTFEHLFLLTQTDGSVSITTGDGYRNITAYDTSGSLTAVLANGDDHILLVNTAAEVSITSANGDRFMNAFNTSGSLTANLGNGDDNIDLDVTEGAIEISSGDGLHNCTFDVTTGSINVTVGNGPSHLFSIAETAGNISLVAGTGDHNVLITDTSEGNIVIITGQNSGVGIFNIEDTVGDVNITSAGGPNDVDIVSTEGDVFVDFQGSGKDDVNLLEIGGTLTVNTWDDDDIVMVDKLFGSLFIDVGSDDDRVYIDYLGGNGTVLGGLGNDLLQLDGRVDDTDDVVNTMDGSYLNWNGGGGDDTVEMYIVSAGTTNLNIVGDNQGINQAKAHCSDVACIMLSRTTFLANIHDPGSPNSSYERINLDNTASMSTFKLYLNGGENSVHFDDTMCVMDVFGGDSSDSFHVGQMYYADRTAAYGVSTNDFIETTLTSKGYLSDGCSHPITLNGGSGDDKYDILRNKCVLDLNGESGEDSFVVRSFIMAVANDGSLEELAPGNITLKGGENGNDNFSVGGSTNPLKKDAPDYVINSLVDIDGGTGSNNLTITGTEENDDYVVKNGLVFGGGLTIKYANIINLVIAGEAGDDEIIVLSTDPSMFLSLYGGLGSDTFTITPRTVSPVVSKNLRGHRGVIEHTVVSNEDEEYDGLVVRGVEANVIDNDGDYGWVYTVDQGGYHFMTEDGDGDFSFYLYPTTIPEDDLYVNIVAPAARDDQRYVLVNESVTEILYWAAGEMSPKEVHVTYNQNVTKLDNTEINLMLKILVDLDGGKTKDANFINTEQSVLPVDIVLLPSMNNTAGAKSVAIRESSSGTKVSEGTNGFDSTYDIYLRPCSSEMLDTISVQMTPTVANQIVIEPSELSGAHFATDCKVSVTVSAVDDDLVEGNHYATILHTVRNTTNGEELLLSDGSPLYAANVLVEIYDDDMPGVIIEETNGVTATAELDATAKSIVGEASYYEDEYSLRLTKQPAGDVEIIVESIEVASDVDIAATPPGRDFSKRKQVLVNGAETHRVIFTPSNWHQSVNIRVTAIDDNIEEGIDLLNFASQPSNLGMIQGPLIISGGDSPYINPLNSPLMLPHESNPIEFIIPPGVVIDVSSVLVNETNQVDTVVFNHQNAKGNADATIIRSHFLGMGMMNDLIISGRGPFSGIVYDELEVLIFNFGEESNILYVNETTEAIHIVNLDSTDGSSDDYVVVRDISGPMLINGGEGQDVVNVSSVEARKLDTIRALLMFDGGDDEDTDTLFLDNSGDVDQDDIVNVTRLLVEVESMKVPDEIISGNGTNPIQPRESYLVTLRNATGGSFGFTLNDPLTGRSGINTAQLPYPPTVGQIEYAINIAILPDQKSCGSLNTSDCASTARAWQLGNSDTYFIAFMGERLNAGVSLSLNSADLENYYEEIFLNATNDAIMKNSDMAYTNVDDLMITLGFRGNVVGNIRGTSANNTFIDMQDGDDKIFVSSDANENHASALSADVLYGLLDYVEGELHIEVNGGRHRLFVSDCFSLLSKGVGNGGFVEITNSSITNLGDAFGDIFFSASSGTWLDDFTLWFGQGDDQILVSTIPTHELSTARVTTAVHAGRGDDTVHVVLDWDEHKGALFVANGQENDDVIDATNSTLPMIIFGDGGDDTLYGGVNENVLFGDYGQVQWKDESGAIVARQGGGGYGDFTDKTARNIHLVESLYPPLITNNFDSGSDIIHGNSARDIIFGSGGALDELHGYNSSDIIVGDFAVILIDETVDYLYGILSIDSHNCTEGGGRNTMTGDEDHDIIIGGGHSVDMIDAGSGSDFASGDCVWMLFDNSDFHLRNVSSTSINVGGIDELRMGDGDDVAIGGQNVDTIYGGLGFDILAGDNSEIVFFPTHLDTEGTPLDNSFSQTFSFWNRPQWIRSNCDKGVDIIYGGTGDGNYIIANDIQGTTMRTDIDFVYDDHGLVLFEEDPVYQFREADQCTRVFVPDFSDSVNLCLDNGEVSNNAHGEVYEHHSKKECCETHFWWRITQCMGNDHLMYYSDSGKCNIKTEFEDWESKFTPAGWSSSGLFGTLEECCGAYFWWDIDNCMMASPHDAKFTFEFKLSDLKAPTSCQEADEIASGWEYVVDNELSESAYSNATSIGCATLWRNPDTGMTECGGCLAGLDYVGNTDEIFTEGTSQPESPWNEDDPEGIYHHARKVLTLITMEVRVFSLECKDAICFHNLLIETIGTLQDFFTSPRFTLAVYEWSRLRGPPIEQLWLAEVDKSSWLHTSSYNPYIISESSRVGLEVKSVAKCELQSVNWASDISADSIVLNVQNTTKKALYSLTGDTRVVSTGIVVEQSLVIEITKLCGQDIGSIQESLQCSENPSTVDFSITMYLPYNAAVNEFSDVMEDQLNNITSFDDGAYPISSCSLSDAEVYSFALYYPDWFKYRSCVNDGRQPQYIRDNPGDYLFEDIDECCQTYFSWDTSCGKISFSGIIFYPSYDLSTCHQKSMSEFDPYDDPKRYATKSSCCMENFGDVMACCEGGDGECDQSGTSIFLPDWTKKTCHARDSALVLFWESKWMSATIEECCNRYFKYDSKCGMDQEFVFAPNHFSMECEAKPLLGIDAWEIQVYDTLYACCSENFPNSITTCCDGVGGCTLSGTIQWLPDWANDHCYEKDKNLIEDWEQHWVHESLETCCDAYFPSSGACNRRNLVTLKYYATDDHCKTKALSAFRAMEDRFDLLDDCCRAKFPQNVSHCCEAGDNGCILSGNLHYIPAWQDRTCYTKDENLLSGWERVFAKATLLECCEHNVHYHVDFCCQNSEGGC